jgi:hypothetical protein
MAVFAFAVSDSLVVGIEVMSDPETIRSLDLMCSHAREWPGWP